MLIQPQNSGSYTLSTKNTNGDCMVVINPASGKKARKTSASIALFSQRLARNESFPSLKPTQGKPILFLDSPGEFERSGVCIYGIDASPHTIFTLETEGMSVLVLGNTWPKKKYTQEQIDHMGQINILLFPQSTPPKESNIPFELLEQLEPQIALFGHIDTATKKKLLSKTGAEEEPLQKIKIQKKDLPHEQMRVVFLQYA